jgi:hypothetical protein
MGSQSSRTPISVYQLYISLRGISPLIWRRLLVTSDTWVAQLHDIIQCAMGWEDLHLHRFCIHGKDYGIYQPGGLLFDDDPTKVFLADFRLRPGERFVYEYDFGDLWQHDIRLERVLALTAGKHYPFCTDAAGDCPPEDCGGPPGYHALITEQYSWLAGLDLQDDVRLVAERLLAFYDGRPRPTRDDTEFVQALERLRQREEHLPARFDRRAVNAALSALGKDLS